MSSQSFALQNGPRRVQRLPQVWKWAVWLVPLHALLLLWGTWERQPSPSTRFAEWADFVSTDRFLWSHLVASIVGQTAGMLGATVLAVLLVRRGAPFVRTAAGLALHLTGSGLMLSGFGVAAFAQPAIGELHASSPELAEEMYRTVYGPAAFVVLLTGLALFSFSSTLATGAALTAARGVPQWAGRVYAVAGPVFGVVGFLFGTFQTLGALALAAAGAAAGHLLDDHGGEVAR